MQRLAILAFFFLVILQGFAVAPAAEKSHYSFIENKGQWPASVMFACDVEGGKIWVESDGLLIDLFDQKVMNAYTDAHHKKTKDGKMPDFLPRHAYKMEFVGASGKAHIEKLNRQSSTYNYFLGNNPEHWGSGAESFGEIVLKNVWPGVDFRLYSKDFVLKYDFIVHPGANAKDIVLRYVGIQPPRPGGNGQMKLSTAFSSVIEQAPVAWDLTASEREYIGCSYRINESTVSFDFDRPLRSDRTLVIDPELIFSTYSGSTSNNFGYTATYDEEGHLYAGSSAFGQGYPSTLGAYDVTFNNGIVDIALSKFNLDGTGLIWSTFLGGASDELPHSLIVNTAGELFVYGTSSSSNFPTTAGAYNASFSGGSPLNLQNGLGVNYTNGSDIVVSRLSANGSQLLASTYVGGTGNDGLNLGTGNGGTALKFNYADEIRGEILIDQQNNIYVATCTNSTDFPTTAGVFQPNPGGGLMDGCVLKMDNSLSTLLWSSYLGGSSGDAVYSIDLDSENNILVSGGTQSANFPTTFGTVQMNYQGGVSDGFVSKINSSGTLLLASTFVGSDTYDQAYFVELDDQDRVHIFGQTQKFGNYWIQNATYGIPAGGQILVKYNPDLSQVIWSTAFGSGNGQPNISPTAFLVDVCSKVYICGWGSAIQGGPLTTNGLPTTAGAFQTTTTGGDFYMMVLQDNASSIFYASYFGGNQSTEHVDGGTSRFDRKGIIYQAVCAGCGGNSDFPIHPNNALSSLNNSSCNLGVFKFDFQLPINVADFSVPPVICLPEQTVFDNNSIGAQTYFWDFGDGQTSTAVNPTHTYTQTGVYDVMLVTSSLTACNPLDTVYQQVVVLSNSTSNLLTANICFGEQIQIGVLPSTDPSITYSWTPANFLSDPSAANPFANPPATTTYTLQISNGTCTDLLLQTVQVNTINLQTSGDQNLCEAGSIVSLEATSSQPGVTYQWSSNPGFTDTLNPNPQTGTAEIEVFDSGTYYVQATLNGCVETAQVNITLNAANTEILGDFIACPNDTINLYVLDPSPLLTYTWTPGANIVSGQNTPQIAVYVTQNTTFTITSTDAEGCSVSDSVEVLVSQLNGGSIQATATPSLIAAGQSTQLNAQPSGYTYQWIPADGLSNAFIQNPVATPEVTTEYTVIISEGDCAYTAVTKVEVIDQLCGPPSIFVPNTFTPNKDNRNDWLYVRGNNLTDLYFVVYDRWGEKIFETKDINVGWDGFFKGDPVSPAVYVYYLEAVCLGGEDYFEKGNITVIR